MLSKSFICEQNILFLQTKNHKIVRLAIFFRMYFGQCDYKNFILLNNRKNKENPVHDQTKRALSAHRHNHRFIVIIAWFAGEKIK